VAHDFNNILGAISGYAEMIKQKFAPGNPKLDKYASAILSGAHKAAELTGQLLAFARRGRYQKLPLDLHELISHTIQLLQHSTGPSIKISRQFSAQYHGIIGDPTQMQNILLSIANNALDAMPLGGSITFTTTNGNIPELLAKSHAETTIGPYVIVSVSDTGTGMDERTKEKLFEPFFTTKDIGKGVGLGLASAYGAVTSHEGLISVDSKPGQGTTVTLFLPVDKSLLQNL
jgi:signal transduction histidine kinase